MASSAWKDFASWWREAKAAGYAPTEFERELRYFTLQAEVSPMALDKAVRVATRRLRDLNLARLQRQVELDWHRANGNR
jgi:hypothetical protein